MIRLLYISTARAGHTAKDMDAILGVSRRNNAACGVTGLLIAGGNRFLQILEGPADPVQRTYDRILGDPRHCAAVILGRRDVDARMFGQWAMGFQPSATNGGNGQVGRDIAALVAAISDPVVRAYFEGFAFQHAA